jgi:hypothetical protein
LNQKYNDSAAAKQPRSNLLVTCLVLGLIIVFTFMLTDYFKQHRLQANLNSQIEGKKQEISSTPSPSADLDKQLEKVKSENQAIKQSLSAKSADSTEIIAALLDAAASCDVKSNNLSTDKWSDKNIGDTTFRLMPVNISLQGSLSDILNLVEKIEDKSAFPSLVIENLSIDEAGGQAIQNSGTASSPPVSAKLTAMLVTRPEPSAGGD